MKSKIAKLAINAIQYFIVSTAIIGNIVTTEQADAQDNPAIKDGNPCIEEICINDEVKNLLKIKWDKVPVANTDDSSLLKAVGDPNAIKVFSRYWSVGNFDNVGLQALTKIAGFCKQPIPSGFSLKGQYANRKGQPVLINFAVVPSKDGKSQKFIVTRIFKFIVKGELTPEQYTDLMNQANQKYQSYYQKPDTSPHYPNVSINSAAGQGAFLQIESQFGQLNPPDAVPIDPSKFQYFPGCGGDRKIKL